ncbi:MAG: sulfatase [Flavobacteriaceae bacterium]
MGKIRNFINSKLTFLSILFFLFITSCNSDERPNIIWLVSEDNSIHFMDLYSKDGAKMPNISSLAKKGVVFNNAFSNAPVCSVARSTIITGVYGPTIGTQYHRKAYPVNLPKYIKPLPLYLRDAGYYTTNNNKEDYNFKKENEIWDESSSKATYKNRKVNQPFFHVQNFGDTHEGRLHFDEEYFKKEIENFNIENTPTFPYHPDTPIFRFTRELLYKHHMSLDSKIGEFIKDLEKQGLMENTIIFYYGDHGGVLPRSKGYLYESGLNIPMVVYVPKKWKNLSPFHIGTKTSAFIDFLDLVPTVLSLAGIEIPNYLDGTPFLGKKIKKESIEQQNITFGYADRFDEKYDLVRSVRKGKYKYIRNFQPFNVDGLYNFYRYKMLAYKEWYNLFVEGKLNKYQAKFFLPKQPEELYDVKKDPHEINNLAKKTNFKNELIELRSQLKKQIISKNDLSFFPEPYFLKKGLENPIDFGKKNKELLISLIEVANLNIYPFQEVRKKIADALNDNNPWIKYWGLIACSSFGMKALENIDKINAIFEDENEENLVRIRALEFLLLNNLKYNVLIMEDLMKSPTNLMEAALMFNSLALFKTINPDFKIELPKSIFPKKWYENQDNLMNRRINYLTNSE